MLKLYKKFIPLIGIFQVALFLTIIILGFFSYSVWSHGSQTFYNYFYGDITNINTLIYQFIFYASILGRLRLLYLNKIKRLKLLASLSSFFYAILITLYIVSAERFFSSARLHDYTNEAAIFLGVYWIISIYIFFIPFLSSLVIAFIAPRYKNEKKLLQEKSNNSKEASTKIRDLKKLLDEGIISKEVFDEKSKKYIEEL